MSGFISGLCRTCYQAFAIYSQFLLLFIATMTIETSSFPSLHQIRMKGQGKDMNNKVSSANSNLFQRIGKRGAIETRGCSFGVKYVLSPSGFGEVRFL